MKDFIVKCGLFIGMLIASLMLMIASPSILALAYSGSVDTSDVIAHDPFAENEGIHLIFSLNTQNNYIPIYYCYFSEVYHDIEYFKILPDPGFNDYDLYIGYNNGTEVPASYPALFPYSCKSVRYPTYERWQTYNPPHLNVADISVYTTISCEVPVYIGDTPEYEPPTPYIDSFNAYISNGGGDICFDLATTEQSEQTNFGINTSYLYYTTQSGYSSEFVVTIGSTTYTVPISSYNLKQFNVYYNGDTQEGALISYSDVQEKQSSVFMAYRAYIANPFPALPVYLYRNLTDLPSQNVIKLYQLLNYINDNGNTSYTMADLLSNDIITYNVRKDGTTVFTRNLDFSNLNPANASTPNPSDIDPTSAPDPDLYPFKYYNYDKIAVSSIDNLGLPNVNFLQAEVDTDGINLFTWIWESIVATPYGVVILCALTFLIIKVVVW